MLKLARRLSLSLCFAIVIFPSCGGGTTDGESVPGFNLDLDTFLTATPDEFSNLINPVFEFISDQAVDHFEASVDGGPFQIVSSPFTVSNLVDGLHSFLVRGVDSDGNVDPTPAEYVWTVDTVNPSSFITFPTLTSLTDADAITIRGGTREDVGVSNLRIAGVDVTTSDNYQTWQVNIPLVKGTNIYFLESTDLAGNTDLFTDAIIVRNLGTVAYDIGAIEVNSAETYIYAIDSTLDAVIRLDMATGHREIISGAEMGSGPKLEAMSSLYLDEPNNRLITVDTGLDQVLAVDLATGDRTVLSDTTPGQATEFVIARGVDFDRAGNRLFVTESLNDRIIQVNLADGSRSVISDSSTGSGTVFNSPFDIAYDNQSNPANPRLFVADINAGILFSVDIATGNRAIFSSAFPIGSGAQLQAPGSVKLDFSNNRLLVMDVDANVNQLIAIDLANGNRTTLATNTSLDTGSNLPGTYAAHALDLNAANDTMYMVSRAGSLVYAQDIASSNVTEVSNMYLGDGIKMLRVESMSLIPGQNELAVSDAWGNAVVRVDTKTGDRAVISNADTGNGTNFSWLGKSIIDDVTVPTIPRLLALDKTLNALFEVDLTTGDRNVLSSSAVGVGYVPTLPRDLALDNDRVLAVDSYVVNGALTGNLFEINLASGDRNIISNQSTGSGINFILSTALSIDKVTDPLNPRALVSDGQQFGVIEVDLATGNRNMFSSNQPEAGLGIPFLLPTGSIVDEVNRRVLVTDFSRKDLLSADLNTGDRQLISGTDEISQISVGSGPPLGQSDEIEVDFDNGLAYINNQQSIILVDLLTGERVIISW